ncbi:putative glycosyltransferase [Candidatus Cyrtobacter comes]|uniref:Glycosyltransferase n=1 Tax=Candidatus Cyrtobacter comes TaxID=675776 RepID=A0ABU5L7T7_9RICK|nr:glycosyltransferase family 88 protein [Candidatus Cyrtobacter comes]MDZ5761935.1 putative glycosyltransferase [Candidatus Cyrtobacter comes]
MYYIPLTKLYKIWFNKNPEEWLDVENQLRFIHMVQKHPEAKISFLYSRELLSERATSDMEEFCKKHGIQPVSIEIFKDKLRNETEKELFDTACTELRRWKDHTGGNPASASDIFRILTPVMNDLGVYSDFDIKVDFSKLTSIMSGKCMALPINLLPATKSATISNELITFAVDNNGNLHADVIKFMDIWQNRVLSAYKDWVSALLVNEDPNSTLSIFVKKFLSSNKEQNRIDEIIDFRHFILKNLDAKFLLCCDIPDLIEKRLHSFRERIGEEYIEAMLHLANLHNQFSDLDISSMTEDEIAITYGRFIVELDPDLEQFNDYAKVSDAHVKLARLQIMKETVILYSGPEVLSTILEKESSKSHQNPYDVFSAYHNNSLALCIIAQPPLKIQNIRDLIDNGHTLLNNDLSWLEEGIIAKEKRVGKMDNDARVIQRGFRSHVKRSQGDGQSHSK